MFIVKHSKRPKVGQLNQRIPTEKLVHWYAGISGNGVRFLCGSTQGTYILYKKKVKCPDCRRALGLIRG